jgi:predicted DCC family thiol-disulfide oxidoreductase YuxK
MNLKGARTSQIDWLLFMNKFIYSQVYFSLIRSLLALLIVFIQMQFMFKGASLLAWQVALSISVIFFSLLFFIGYKRRLASFLMLLSMFFLPVFKGDLYVFFLLLAYIIILSGEYLSFDFMKNKNIRWRMKKQWFYIFFILLCFAHFSEAVIGLIIEFIEEGFILNNFLDKGELAFIFFETYGEKYLENILLVTITIKIVSLFLSFFIKGRFCAWSLLFIVSILFTSSLIEFFSVSLCYLFLLDPTWLKSSPSKAIVFFDGRCVICNQFVDYILSEDINKSIVFASLQGLTAKKIFDKEENPLPIGIDSIVFYRTKKAKYYLEAIAEIFKTMGGNNRIVAYLIMIFPKKFTKTLYNLIAKNRYKLFGKLDQCRVPTNEEKDRILP